MYVKGEALTLIPSLLMFTIAVYFSILMLYFVNDVGSLRLISLFSLCFYYAGIALALCWFVYWGLYRAAKKTRAIT